MPVRLYAASGSRDVPIAKACHCQQALRTRGVWARLMDIGGVDHFGSEVQSLPLVSEQFAAVRARDCGTPALAEDAWGAGRPEPALLPWHITLDLAPYAERRSDGV